MQCEDVRQRLTDRLSSPLSENDERAVREHLGSCLTCRAEATAIDGLWENLGAIPAEPANSDAMRSQFYAALDQQMAADRRGGWMARAGLAQLAAAAVLLLVGFLAGRMVPVGTARQGGDEIAGLRSEIHEVRQVALLSLLQQQSATDRLRGVNSTSQLEQPGDEVLTALLNTLMHDTNINVRLACLDALSRFADQQRVRTGTVAALGAANSPLLQIALIDFVVETKERDSIDTLKRLAGDPAADIAVRDRARRGLQQIG